jgi:hypothetical protein
MAAVAFKQFDLHDDTHSRSQVPNSHIQVAACKFRESKQQRLSECRDLGVELKFLYCKGYSRLQSLNE